MRLCHRTTGACCCQSRFVPKIHLHGETTREGGKVTYLAGLGHGHAQKGCLASVRAGTVVGLRKLFERLHRSCCAERVRVTMTIMLVGLFVLFHGLCNDSPLKIGGCQFCAFRRDTSVDGIQGRKGIRGWRGQIKTHLLRQCPHSESYLASARQHRVCWKINRCCQTNCQQHAAKPS